MKVNDSLFGYILVLILCGIHLIVCLLIGTELMKFSALLLFGNMLGILLEMSFGSVSKKICKNFDLILYVFIAISILAMMLNFTDLSIYIMKLDSFTFDLFDCSKSGITEVTMSSVGISIFVLELFSIKAFNNSFSRQKGATQQTKVYS